MIGVVATLKIQDGKASEFEAAANDLMARVHANEPDCLTYQLYRSMTDDATYIFMEQYESKAAFDAHGKTDYFQAAMPKLGACLAAPPDIQVFDKVG